MFNPTKMPELIKNTAPEGAKCQYCGKIDEEVGMFHFANRWWLVCDKQECLEGAISDTIDHLKGLI